MLFVWMSICVGAGFAAGWAAASRQRREERRLQARLLSFAAHEVNTPVTSMYMTAMNFKNGLFGPIPEEQRPWMAILREQTCRLSCLVGDLRDLIHSEFHGDLEPKPEETDIRGLISACLDSMQESLARAGAAVETRIEEDLPPAYVSADRLQRCLSAVLAHARKFRAQGEEPILLSAARGREEIHLRVEYAGMKAPAGSLDRALDLYFPVLAEGSEVLSGVGMGLGLTRRLIETEGGRMRLEAADDGRVAIAIDVPRYKGEG